MRVVVLDPYSCSLFDQQLGDGADGLEIKLK
jgi:hypothetical protein